MYVHLRIAHTLLTLHAPEVEQGQNMGILQDLTLLPPGASVFQNHILLLPLLPYHLRFGLPFALGLYKEGYFQCVSFDDTAMVRC